MIMLPLLIASLVYIMLLIVVYFSKKHIDTSENRIYKKLLILNVIGLLIDMSCIVATRHLDAIPIIVNTLCRILLVYYVSFIMLYTYYVLMISRKSKEQINIYLKKCKYICILVFIIASLFVMFLPMNFYRDVNYVYTYGIAIDFLTIFLVVVMLAWLVLLIKNFKNIKEKKYYPVIIFIILAVAGGIIQNLIPQLLITTSIETFIVFLMYFTIENPDVKVLNELYKNKELMEQNYEDKYNFLFEITQEARNPLVRISSICNELKNENDKDKIKLGASVIDNLVKELDFSINNVLNISTLDVQKLRLVDSKYDLSKISNDLVSRIKDNVKDSVEFRYSFPQVSPIFYGDYMKLRQILYSLLINSSKYTTTGYIDFKVNLVEKYDVCRIIFTITDSGTGMTLDQVNELLSVTGELNKQEMIDLDKKEYNIKLCQKIIKIMGGSLIIKSDFGKGTVIKLIIDQRVYHDSEDSLLTHYENAINNRKKILIVSQDNKLTRMIKYKCQEHDIDYVSLLYGMDAIDRIKASKKYDFILVSDEMKEMSGLMTLKGMMEVNNFKTPVIVMLKSDKENIKEHYLDDGFIDYLLISDLDNEIERILNRY